MPNKEGSTGSLPCVKVVPSKHALVKLGEGDSKCGPRCRKYLSTQREDDSLLDLPCGKNLLTQIERMILCCRKVRATQREDYPLFNLFHRKGLLPQREDESLLGLPCRKGSLTQRRGDYLIDLFSRRGLIT